MSAAIPPVKPHRLPRAADYNQMVDAVNAFNRLQGASGVTAAIKNGQLIISGEGSPARGGPPIVTGQNKTGTRIELGQIAALPRLAGDLYDFADAVDPNRWNCEAWPIYWGAPTAAHGYATLGTPWGVALDVIEVNQFGRFAVGGPALALVNVQAAGDGFVLPYHGEMTLRSARGGGAGALWWAASGTGEQWAVVNLAPLGAPALGVVKLTSAPSGGAATAKLVYANAGMAVTVGDNLQVEVFNS